MNRREFIGLLTDSLVGRVPAKLVSEKADYYRNYISDTARDENLSEAEVIDRLGPPEAIAHTIVDRYEAEYGIYEGSEASVEDESRSSVFDGQRGSGQEEETSPIQRGIFSLLSGNGCLIALFVVTILACVLLFSIVKVFAAYPALCLIIVLILVLRGEYKNRH